uniref:Uncharacterized protein n=1 Tax=Anguilla anguilla TaxID=7936 RepID=A0A0E9SI84_ANGAN
MLLIKSKLITAFFLMLIFQPLHYTSVNVSCNFH